MASPINKIRSRSHGFVLLATIWFLAVISLFVGYFATRIDRSVATAFRLQEQMQTSLDEQATVNTLLYLALTRSFDVAGIKVKPFEEALVSATVLGPRESQLTGNELRLDNRAYQGIGGSFFSLQDAGSLISLRGNNTLRLRQLLLNQGASESEATTFISRLKDYTDQDELTELNGAESRDYREWGYIPPTNRFLLSPLQLMNIPGWDKWLDSDQANGLMSELTIYVANRQNFNVMTRLGMETLGSMEPESQDQIIKGRQETAYFTIAEVNQQAGTLITYDPLAVSLYPSNYLRLTSWHENSGQTRLTGITLDPLSLGKPWFIDYQINIGAQARLFSHHDKNTAPSVPSTLLLR